MFKRTFLVALVVIIMFAGFMLADMAIETDAAQAFQEVETSATQETQKIEIEENEESENETSDIVEEVIKPEMPRRIFDKDVVFTGEYISGNTKMPYAFFTPSNVEAEEKLPLIVWLHGAGELNVTSGWFMQRGFPKIVENWQTDGFKAYIVCPHLSSVGTNRWDSELSKKNLQEVLDYVISEYNIDTENIMLAGHSLGGQGAIYMAQEMDCFKKCIVLSGYCPGIGMKDTETMIIGYTGTTAFGEDSTSVKFMSRMFAERHESHFIEAGHGEVPQKAFELDEDNDNRSDLMEWFFEKELENIKNEENDSRALALELFRFLICYK